MLLKVCDKIQHLLEGGWRENVYVSKTTTVSRAKSRGAVVSDVTSVFGSEVRRLFNKQGPEVIRIEREVIITLSGTEVSTLFG